MTEDPKVKGRYIPLVLASVCNGLGAGFNGQRSEGSPAP